MKKYFVLLIAFIDIEHFLIQVVVEAKDRASSGLANSVQTTIIVEVRPLTLNLN